MCINKNSAQDADNFDDNVVEKFIPIKNRGVEFTFKK